MEINSVVSSSFVGYCRSLSVHVPLRMDFFPTKFSVWVISSLEFKAQLSTFELQNVTSVPQSDGVNRR